MRRIILAAIGCIGASVAHADEDCAATETTQAGLTECAGRNYEAADKELNGVYRLVSHRLEGSPDGAKALVVSQRAWIAFRDAECRFVVSGMGRASALPMIESQCRAGLTRKRAADLKGYLNCEEGDISCPVPRP